MRGTTMATPEVGTMWNEAPDFPRGSGEAPRRPDWFGTSSGGRVRHIRAESPGHAVGIRRGATEKIGR